MELPTDQQFDSRIEKIMHDLPLRKMRKSAELKFYIRLLWLHIKMHTPRLVRQTAPVLGAFAVIVFVSTLALSWQKNIPVIREQNHAPQFLENMPPPTSESKDQPPPANKKKFQNVPTIPPPVQEPAPTPIPEPAQPSAALEQQAPPTTPQESESEYGDAESEAEEESTPLEETAPTPPGASMMTAPPTSSPQEQEAQSQMAQAEAKITAAENFQAKASVAPSGGDQASAKMYSPQAAENLKLAKEKLAQAKAVFNQKNYARAASLARESQQLAMQASQ